MISTKAEKYIDDDAVVMNNGDRMVDASTAYMAVELAEEEMIEKAGRVFAEYCEMYAGDGKCLERGECAICARIVEFKQKMKE